MSKISIFGYPASCYVNKKKVARQRGLVGTDKIAEVRPERKDIIHNVST